MASSALARQTRAAEAAKRSATFARIRAKSAEKVARISGKLREMKVAEKAQQSAGIAGVGGGGWLAGQVAKQDWFADDQGVSRAKYVNYGAFGLALLAVMTGKARSKPAMLGVAVGAGMGAGQLAIDSLASETDIFGSLTGGE